MPKFRVRRPVVLWRRPLPNLACSTGEIHHTRYHYRHGRRVTTGPETDGSLGGNNKNYPTLMRTKPASLECSEPLSLRNKASKPSLAVLSQFKSLGILKYRGQRGAGISRSTSAKKILVMQGRRFIKAEGRKVDRSNLINISLVNTTNKTSTSKSTGFAVPKCLFTNICGLSKTKNRVRPEISGH